MKLIKQLFMISCKEATYLVSLKEEGKLSFSKYLKLELHLAICILCKRFEIQTGHFCNIAKQHPLKPEAKMSKEKKVAIKKLLEEV
jgi:hypothetical protein